jgi:hypothetical protein
MHFVTRLAGGVYKVKQTHEPPGGYQTGYSGSFVPGKIGGKPAMDLKQAKLAPVTATTMWCDCECIFDLYTELTGVPGGVIKLELTREVGKKKVIFSGKLDLSKITGVITLSTKKLPICLAP